jgi:hypothetical protein
MSETRVGVGEIVLVPEKIRQPQPERYSADLLRKPFELERGDELADKVFIMAKIEHQENTWV